MFCHIARWTICHTCLICSSVTSRWWAVDGVLQQCDHLSTVTSCLTHYSKKQKKRNIASCLAYRSQSMWCNLWHEVVMGRSRFVALSAFTAPLSMHLWDTCETHVQDLPGYGSTDCPCLDRSGWCRCCFLAPMKCCEHLWQCCTCLLKCMSQLPGLPFQVCGHVWTQVNLSFGLHRMCVWA